MLVRTNDGGVDEDFGEVPFSSECSEYPMPHASARPTREALARAVPASELLWQIAPWAARTSNPENRIDEQPTVFAVATAITDLPRQQTLDSLPLVIPKLPCHRASAPINRSDA
jgi:hypothetical protein